MKTIENQIDELFEVEFARHPNEVLSFVDKLVEKLPQTEAKYRRYLVAALVLIAVGEMINIGIVEEASLASFKVSALQTLLIVWPILLGFTSYLMYSSNAASLMLGHAITRSYKYILPKAFDNDSETLIFIDTEFGVERALAPTDSHPSGLPGKIINGIWNVIYIGTNLLLVPVAMLYFTVMLHRSMHWPTWAVVLSAFIGIMAMIRGYLLWFRAGSLLGEE